MELGAVQILQIDLDEKNILVVNAPKNSGSDIDHWLRDTAAALQSWIKDDSSPLFVLISTEEIEIRLEKVEDTKNEAESLIYQLYQWVGFKYTTDHNAYKICFFCSEDYPKHTDDCPYAGILKYMVKKDSEAVWYRQLKKP